MFRIDGQCPAINLKLMAGSSQKAALVDPRPQRVCKCNVVFDKCKMTTTQKIIPLMR
jgi:hypothetical protein